MARPGAPPSAADLNVSVMEYFKPENRGLVVRRGELEGILTQYHRARMAERWWVKLWMGARRYLARSAVAPLRDGEGKPS